MADSLLPEDNQAPEEREALLNKWKDKTKEEILEAKINSDLFIKSQNARFDDLKKDYLTLREQHQASDDLKTLLDQAKKQLSNPDTTQNTQREPVQTAIKPEDINALIQAQVAEEIARNRKVTTQSENFNTMQAKLKEHFGDNYEALYKQRLDQLGLSKEFADNLAKDHPTVFMKTFELDVQRQAVNNAPPRSTQRQTTFAPTTQKRDWNYYQELKKSNPKLYLDPKIAIQMHDDAIALGDSFGMPQE